MGWIRYILARRWKVSLLFFCLVVVIIRTISLKIGEDISSFDVGSMSRAQMLSLIWCFAGQFHGLV